VCVCEVIHAMNHGRVVGGCVSGCTAHVHPPPPPSAHCAQQHVRAPPHRRMYLAAHYVAMAGASQAAGLKELCAQQLTSALRYCGVIPADKVRPAPDATQPCARVCASQNKGLCAQQLTSALRHCGGIPADKVRPAPDVTQPCARVCVRAKTTSFALS